MHVIVSGWLAPYTRSPCGPPCRTQGCIPHDHPGPPCWVRQARLGLAKAGRSKSLAPCSAALPHATAIGAAMAALCYRRLVVASTPRYGSTPLSTLSVALPLLHVHFTYPQHMAVPTVASPIKARQSLMPC